MVSFLAQVLVFVHKLMLVLLLLGVGCLGASRVYVMCQKGFAHFLGLVDSDQWDQDIAALRQRAKEAAEQAERTAARRRLQGELEAGGALPARLDVVCAGGGLEVSSEEGPSRHPARQGADWGCDGSLAGEAPNHVRSGSRNRSWGMRTPCNISTRLPRAMRHRMNSHHETPPVSGTTGRPVQSEEGGRSSTRPRPQAAVEGQRKPAEAEVGRPRDARCWGFGRSEASCPDMPRPDFFRTAPLEI
ncbi:unnamed protein product [Prorocentrum cordatum]|uniref:Uncharacterized protein n=1 Tax=Prorocentrum cordatum TaxID=2364126 RepID=A0ABN9TKE3_9DINO|nr:unnamed protein product [Polarella glacialis]